ncbi:molecular chaperone DnaJ [Paraburkholderia sp. MM5482-R1]|uniref:molecular chaperone DnaJ n=1 Tax=unclassified Paraburkholderia TaxID=2615204 RepID=UPI003D252BB5
MTSAHRRSVSIAVGHNKASLSKGQKAFNTLIRQIEKRRNRLGAWEAVAPAFQKKYVDELLPLERLSTDLRVKMVYRLEEACNQKGLTASERRMISELVTGLAGELIEGCDDTQLKAIYNRHSQSDYDSEAAAELEDMKSVLEMMLGVELGDDLDMSSPEEVLQRAHARMEEQQAQEVAENQAREERRAKRKKSAKQLAAQARQEAEQAQLSQSIREVYRKLASALHPDREPDPQERQRKTALMQRVNQAYAKNNLLQLLELQLELEHIDQSAVNNISEYRLKHYNSILKEQLGELDQEILHVEAGFRQAYGIPPFIEVSPDTVIRNLAGDIAEIQHSIRDLEKNLLAFEDLRKLKIWLKDLKRRQAALRFEEMPF